MNTRSKFIMVVSLAIVIGIPGNQHRQAGNAVAASFLVQQTWGENSAICLWDGAALRAEPVQNSKLLTSIVLGEKLTWSGLSKVDETRKTRIEYYKVQLSDGTEGWISANLIAVNARPAVITRRTPIYRRPDLVTITDRNFEPMAMVAVAQPVNEWAEVTGVKREITGWINNLKSLTFKDDDVAVAIFYTKANAEQDPEKRKEKIKEIINNPAFANSMFIPDLRDLIEQLEPKALKRTEESWYSNENNIIYFNFRTFEVTASSYLDNDQAYQPENVADGDRTTAWVEGVAGDGIGESITLTLPEPRRVTEIGIIPGYARSEKVWTINNRVAQAKIIVNDTYSTFSTFVNKYTDQPLSTREAYQWINLENYGEPIKKIQIIITMIYKGTTYEDTCIGEILLREQLKQEP